MTRARILSLVGFAILLIILGSVLYFLKQAPASAANATAPQATSTADIPAAAPAAFIPRTPPQGWKEYDNTTYNFSLFYPDDLSLADHVQPDGEHTAVFDDPAGNKGFQVFIVPYTETQITQSRFLLDDPSGVMQEPVDVTVDGVRGTIFFSTNPIMGDTRERWFIRGDYLYEVTTYKPLDTWLADIMKTWQFLN
jgi:hypothetical protein